MTILAYGNPYRPRFDPDEKHIRLKLAGLLGFHYLILSVLPLGFVTAVFIGAASTIFILNYVYRIHEQISWWLASRFAPIPQSELDARMIKALEQFALVYALRYPGEPFPDGRRMRFSLTDPSWSNWRCTSIMEAEAHGKWVRLTLCEHFEKVMLQGYPRRRIAATALKLKGRGLIGPTLKPSNHALIRTRLATTP